MSTINAQPLFNNAALNRFQETSGRTAARIAPNATAAAPASPQDLLAAMEQQNRASAVAEITSVDLADAATQFTKLNFQNNPGIATQSQGNLNAQSVFRLLQN